MVDIFSDGVDPARDIPKKRPLGVDTENDFVIEQVGRYGHFIVKRERGQIPKSLEGVFTNQRSAEIAVKNYQHSKK
jgi:hypothetical protein